MNLHTRFTTCIYPISELPIISMHCTICSMIFFPYHLRILNLAWIRPTIQPRNQYVRLAPSSVCNDHYSKYVSFEVVFKFPFYLQDNTTRVGTLIVATIYLQLIQNGYTFRSFTVLQCSHQHCVQPVASDVEVVGYL